MIRLSAVLAALLVTMAPAAAHQGHAHVEEHVSRIAADVPDVVLADQTGAPVRIAELLARPDATTMVTFTYTRCKTLCPMVVPMAIQVAREVEALGQPARLVVLTVDPEHDGIAELAQHADQLPTGPGDLFLSGDVADMRRVLAFFGLTLRNPEDHPPLILVRRPDDGGFVRIVVGDRTSNGRLLEVVLGGR